MKRIVLLFAAGLAVPGCLWNLSGPSTTASLLEEEQRTTQIDWTLIKQEFPVLRVVSGDMLEIEYPIEGSWEKVRVKLLGVDAPDRHVMDGVPVITEFQGLHAFAVVMVALDRGTANPEMLSLSDRDMLEEKIRSLLEKKGSDVSLRGVRLIDDGWETRTQIWPYVPLRADVEYNRETRARRVKCLYAYVYAGNLMLNRFLIEEGFARVHPTHIFELRQTFEAAQARAERRRVGIWSLKNP
ncbi:MAG: thermonuclease family protein [Planctomycetes bacterium]|jgi:endonuclease YncB( thermonuclease family)|nr:thermonuclease family protein [Planctomycetota bacterium]